MTTSLELFRTRLRHRSRRSGPNHDHLLRPLSLAPTTRWATKWLNAIIVPATRRAHRLDWTIRLAAQCRTRLVILASHECDMVDAAKRVAEVPFARALIVEVPRRHDHDILKLQTSASRFHELNAWRESNLSLKRNVGLLLARLRGWRKVLFLDDDILDVTPQVVERVAHHLENHRYAGLRTVAKEDNSVVCHANRLSGQEQSIFVTGAALGVNTSDLPLDVFPDVYNEDWFAFAVQALRGGVGEAGTARQLDFNPFKDPERAAREEFGDVLAEGLYTLFGRGDGPSRATSTYWDWFLSSRAEFIDGIEHDLEGIWTHESVQAQASLARARKQLNLITPEDCVAFVDAWRQDSRTFGKATTRLGTGLSVAHALDFLELPHWQEAEYLSASLPTRACRR